MSLISHLVEGYLPEQFFVELTPNFICGICGKVAREAVECPTGQHFFCEPCVQRSRFADCSCCRVDLNFKSLLPNEGARQVVNNCMIHCEYGNCSWQGRVSAYQSHQAMECQYVRCACPLQCGFVIPRYQQESHAASCPNVPITCSHCSGVVPRIGMTDHLRQCPMVVIPCPNQCMRLVTRANLAYHREHQCSRRMVNCTLNHHCQELFVAEDLELHIQQSEAQERQERERERLLQEQRLQHQQQQLRERLRERVSQNPSASVATSHYGPGGGSHSSPHRQSRSRRSASRERQRSSFPREDYSPSPEYRLRDRRDNGDRYSRGRTPPPSQDRRERDPPEGRHHRSNQRDEDQEEDRRDRRSSTAGESRDGRQREEQRDRNGRVKPPPSALHAVVKAEEASPFLKTVVSYHICNADKKKCGCQFSEPHHVCNGTNCKCDKERAKHICNATICACTYVKSSLSTNCRCTFAINRHICNGGRACICSVEYREHICNATPNCNCCFDAEKHLCFST